MKRAPPPGRSRRPRAARTPPREFAALAGRLGERVRALRSANDETLAQLAARAGLSRRFLTDVELGKANVSLLGLQRIADALAVPLATLLAPDDAARTSERERLVALVRRLPARALRDGAVRLEELIERPPPALRVALIGLRGAGKSALGRAAAGLCGLRFVELDQEIEAAAGMPLADLFTLHGEAWYRQLELQELVRLCEDPRDLLVATGGGIVAAPDAYELLRRRFVVVWLEAAPEDHWNRVVAQGDRRPMEGQPAAMARLRQILAERAPLYGLAHHAIDTSALGETASVERLVALIEGAR